MSTNREEETSQRGTRLILFLLIACNHKPLNVFGTNNAAHYHLQMAVNAVNASAKCDIFNLVKSRESFSTVKVTYDLNNISKYNEDNNIKGIVGYYDPIKDDIFYATFPGWFEEAGALILMHELGHALGAEHMSYGIMMPGGTNLGFSDEMSLPNAADSLLAALRAQGIGYCQWDEKHGYQGGK